MTKINMNREVQSAIALSEPSAELQRLRTYNALLLDTLRELHGYAKESHRAAHRADAAYRSLMKKVKKVIE